MYLINDVAYHQKIMSTGVLIYHSIGLKLKKKLLFDYYFLGTTNLTQIMKTIRGIYSLNNNNNKNTPNTYLQTHDLDAKEIRCYLLCVFRFSFIILLIFGYTHESKQKRTKRECCIVLKIII